MGTEGPVDNIGKIEEQDVVGHPYPPGVRERYGRREVVLRLFRSLHDLSDNYVGERDTPALDVIDDVIINLESIGELTLRQSGEVARRPDAVPNTGVSDHPTHVITPAISSGSRVGTGVCGG